MISKNEFLTQLSQELGRFDFSLLGMFKCPVCLKNFDASFFETGSPKNHVSEEHIVPESVGGKQTTFLCKSCNSMFGHKQTKWLGEYIEIMEGGAPFHPDPKKQRASASANGWTVNGSLRLADDGAIEFLSDLGRSNPSHYEASISDDEVPELKISFPMKIFENEQIFRVGMLTAAYGLLFKNFGYSFVLQSCLDIVRQQILNPSEDLMSWNYLLELSSGDLLEPRVVIMRFEADYFLCAVIYDHLVIFPSPSNPCPKSTSEISGKVMSFDQMIAPRLEHRYIGPAVVLCAGQTLIEPDLISRATISPQYVWIDGF